MPLPACHWAPLDHPRVPLIWVWVGGVSSSCQEVTEFLFRIHPSLSGGPGGQLSPPVPLEVPEEPSGGARGTSKITLTLTSVSDLSAHLPPPPPL